MSKPKDLVCEMCEKKSKARVIIHTMLRADGGWVQCHIYENGWIGECDGVDTCPICTGNIEISFVGLSKLNRVKKADYRKGVLNSLSIAEVEKIINDNKDAKVKILDNGEVRAARG
ncbi:hypothetical protein LCGC14_1215840 [marine sediment metagenome]|uniref:Uncharacterized protein n=1 Tax=marine sediment metagenome TaxID=412755 RepID=A0A0F9LGV3_9ZZZZ